MVRKTKPPRMQTGLSQMNSCLSVWRETYARFGGQEAFPHVRRVVDAAIAHKMVDPAKIGNTDADPKQLDFKLVNVIAAHIFRKRKSNRKDFPSEYFEKSPHVVRGFDIFDSLRENDLGVQDCKRYQELLRDPSLGLLARMVDLTQYMGAAGPQSEVELAYLDPAVFYMYESDRGKTEYELVACAAKNIYSPLADLFGYRDLAGALYQLYYYHIDRPTYNEVEQAIFLLEHQLEMTRLVADAVIAQLRVKLKKEGYDFKIRVRSKKHSGKVMEKADRYSREQRRKIQDVVSDLNDHVAFIVILNSKNGKTISQSDIEEFRKIAHMITDITRGIWPLRSKDNEKMFTDMITLPKPNGYQAFHVDMNLEGHEAVNLEAQIKTPAMDEYAERGGAAHYLYKAGGNLLRSFRGTYSCVVRELTHRATQILSVDDTASQRRLTVFVKGEQEPRIRIIHEDAIVAEALIVADIDLMQGPRLNPPISLLAPIKQLKEITLELTQKRLQIPESIYDRLIEKSVYDHTREKLSEYRSQSKKRSKP